MSKFGLADVVADRERTEEEQASLSQRLAAFPPAAPRVRVDLAAVDAAAAPLGFTSREPAPVAVTPSLSQEHPVAGRRRRLTPYEPTRHLAIRLSETQYSRFVAYADRHRLTYHEALQQLMDESDAAVKELGTATN